MADVKVQLMDKGPIIISGEIVLADGTGAKIDTGGKPNVALCRCGHSKNSPFCDGSHKSCEFNVVDRAE